MRAFFFFCFLAPSLFFSNCKKDNAPTSSEPAPKIISTAGYGSYIDSLYYKMWSDSTWEKFGHVIVVNNLTYITTINNAGDEYYYGINGCSGFKPKGENLIIFDRPMYPLRDTIVFNDVYTRVTFFTYQGYRFTMQYYYTLLDTVSVSVPFGLFNPCLWFKGKSTLSAGSESESNSTEFWMVKGPSTIRETESDGFTIEMVRGIVNGQGWGMTIPRSSVHPEVSLGRSHSIVGLLCRIDCPVEFLRIMRCKVFR